MRVAFLGTGGSGAPPGRAENCLLVEAGDARLLLDAGPGCAQRLQEVGYRACDIDYVYLTHTHIDHWSGLFDVAVYAAADRCRPPRLAAASPVAGEVLGAVVPRLPGEYRRQEAPVVAVEPGAGWSPGAQLRLEPVEGVHAVTSYGVLVYWEGEPVLYYSGDTAATGTVRGVVGRVRLAAVEATLPSGLDDVASETGHHTVEQVLSYRGVMREGSLLVPVHLTRESLGELLGRLRSGTVPRGVVVPVDGLWLSL